MKIFRIILGIIIAALGIGIAAVGYAFARYGQWHPIINIFAGAVMALFAFAFTYSGVRLIWGEAVSDVLGGVVTALPGHRGVGMHYSKAVEHYRSASRLKEILGKIFLYGGLALLIIFISLLSVLRVFRSFRLH
jgi:hypothetical protein